MTAPKVIDPGAEPSKPHSLEWIIDFVHRNPHCTLTHGEAGLLVAEIDRLRSESAVYLDELNQRDEDESKQRLAD